MYGEGTETMKRDLEGSKVMDDDCSHLACLLMWYNRWLVHLGRTQPPKNSQERKLGTRKVSGDRCLELAVWVSDDTWIEVELA